MTSRERLLRAIECKSVDRVPISTYELCGYNTQSFENKESSYFSLMERIRKDTDCITMWNPNSNEVLMQSAAPVKVDVQETYNNGFTKYVKTATVGGRTLSQVLKVDDNVVTVWQTKHWCDDIDDVDALLGIDYEPLTFDYSDFSRISSEVGDRGIIMATLADPVCIAAELMSFGDFTVWAMTEKEHFAKTLEKIYERMRPNYERLLQAGLVDLYRIVGPEYCTPPYLPPKFFSEFVTPYVKDITSLIHSYGKKARIHSHGKIGAAIGDLLETGADGLDPIEDIPDGDTKLCDVKKMLQGKMCLFGNMQLKLLEHGTTAQVRDQVKYIMDSAKDGNGFIIMPTAAPINIPLSQKTQDNYFAYIDAALELGKY